MQKLRKKLTKYVLCCGHFILWLVCQNCKSISSCIVCLKKLTDKKTLIAILASCGALLIMIIVLGICVSHRRKPYNENQVDIKHLPSRKNCFCLLNWHLTEKKKT
ncbi:hypothetical protein ATANTOWER_006496 [Ataeniobius toweri]|uniref:Uncharacterized protein n=1 Tax=Ataeniobius toweri TaxID=208326 RepID=A0ABU7AA80_9TELE|nr:hypothetical protein [Ataeniobius toweri]